jgi:ESX secretion system protein EccC
MSQAVVPNAVVSRSAVVVHRPVRAYPRSLPAGELTVAAPPPVGWAGSGAAAWLQYLVPLLGSGGSVAFLFAVPGPRPAWLVAVVVGGAVASVGLGLLLRLVERRSARRARRRERSRYLAHLDQVAARVAELAAAQSAAADFLHPDPPRLWSLVNQGDRLWERRPTDDDFLQVRIGRGPVPLAAAVRLDPGGGPLVEHDPDLLAAAEELVGRSRYLPTAPVTVPLRRLGVLAVTGPPHRTRALARALVCQLAALHAPEDLRILAAFPPPALGEWDWLKWLPHTRPPHTRPPIWDDHAGITPGPRPRPGGLVEGPTGPDGGPRCLLADDSAGLAELLDQEVRPRLVDPTPGSPPGSPPGEAPGAGPLPHLVAVLDQPPGGVPEELLDRAAVVGVTVIWLAPDTAGEPSELAVRVRVDERGTARLEQTGPGGRLVDGIVADSGGLALCETIARRLAPLRLDRRPDATRAATTLGSVRLLDLLGLGGPPFDAAAVQRSRPRSGLLRVPIGGRAHGGPLVLDLKEAAEGGMGPHGLVVGATGSGKSELLRTVVAGLAATHPPEELAFVLVDFKGGAAFADLASLPHVAGLITNLQADLSMVDRAMAALAGEQTRRQRILHRTGNLPDLRAYAARRGADPRLDALPHLLVVVDEFGELLTARPEFLDVFTGIGRVGRSLGMHLLLASQRLDEGRLHGLDGHLRYRICLRTFSAAESTAVLGTPAAYHLPPSPGTALLKVDAAPPLQFHTALISARPSPAPRASPPRPGSGPAVAAHGWPPWILPFTATRPASAGEAAAAATASVPSSRGPAALAGPAVGRSPGGEATGADRPSDLEVLVGSLAGAGPPVHQVWLPPLAAHVPLDGLLDAAEPGWLRVPVGLVDRPADQVQEPLLLDLSGAAGHLAVVGAPRSGKSTLLCTVVAALAATHPPDAVQAYAIDLGGGRLHRLAELPHVGAVCGAREPERVRRLVRELLRIVTDREQRFRELGVDSMASWHGLRRARLELDEYGEVFLVVDNWGALVRELPDLEPEITGLAATGLHFGVHLVLAANRWAELRPGLRDNLGGRLELRLNDPLESEFGRAAAGALPRLPGRGLTDPGLQFQAAAPGTSRQVRNRALTGELGSGAPPLRMLPPQLREDDLPAGERGVRAGLPFAVEEHRLQPVWLDLFTGPAHLLVLGDAECGKTSLLRLIARGLAARHPPAEVALVVLDLRRGLPDLADLPHLAGYARTPAGVAETMERLRTRLLQGPATNPSLELAAAAPMSLEPPAHDLLEWEPAGPLPMELPCAPDRSATAQAALAGEPSPVEPAVPGRPRYVVLVDDYDLLPAAGGSPLAPLLDLLGQGHELGLHVVLARGVAGAARASFEPVFQRLRELGGPGLIMSGDPAEGPLLGAHKAVELVPGRGLLVRRRQPATLVQVAYCPPPTASPTSPAGSFGMVRDASEPLAVPAGQHRRLPGSEGG